MQTKHAHSRTGDPDGASATIERAASTFDLDTGVLCLDFTNTLEARLDPVVRDLLRDYAAILGFARASGTLDEQTAKHLLAQAERRPAEANAALKQGIEQREALFSIFSALAAGAEPAPADLERFNDALADAMTHARIVTAADGSFQWDWQPANGDLSRPLWPILRSAADLLTSEQLPRLRQCAAHDCAWLFLDTSRNASRRWCSMSSCGNRAKVQQFRQRTKKVTGDR
jgi:predicted RNA-binding Zn ribbon-like protein